MRHSPGAVPAGKKRGCSRIRRADIGSAIRNSCPRAVPPPGYHPPRFWTMPSVRNFARCSAVVALLAALSIDPLAESTSVRDDAGRRL